MSNNEHLEARDAHRAFRCTFGPVREMDLVWPPPDEDVDACAVVHLDGGDRPERAPRPEKAPQGAAVPQAAPAPLSEPARQEEPASIIVAPQLRPLLKPTFGDCRDPGRRAADPAAARPDGATAASGRADR